MKNLFEEIEKDVSAILKIAPLAPISMVSTLPGSYYRSVREPSNTILLGLIENILDLHLNDDLRSQLIKDLRKKLKKENVDFFPDEFQSASGFQPIIGHLIDFGLKFLPSTIGYDDLWSQHLKGSDKRHFDGARNMDWRVGANLRKAQMGSDKEQREFMKEHGGHLPNYYSSPKHREYLIANEPYKIQIKTTKPLFNALIEAISENNIAYLGNSESWVHVEIDIQ